MDQPLDSLLQKIIMHASNRTHPLDIGHPPGFPEVVNYAEINRGWNEGRQGQKLSAIGTEHPVESFLTHDFDRTAIQFTNATQQSNPNAGISKVLSLSKVPQKDLMSSKPTGKSIYSHQIPQQHPSDESAFTYGFRTAGQIERQYSLNSGRSEPMDFFNSFDSLKTPRQPDREPTTPFSTSRFVYNSPMEAVHTPSSVNVNSSPTARISLRREGGVQPSQISFGKKSLHSDEEVFPYTLVQQEGAKVAGKSNLIPTTPRDPPTVQGIQLMSPLDLPDRFRLVFPYELFNAVQSKSFAAVYNTTDNVVIAAPTGSGKTAIMELAICKLVQVYGSNQFKVVYQAPTKSLCAERARDWAKKFSHLNLLCAELTGDTDSSEMQKVGRAVIIVTTPEKWDSITRKWKDYIKLLQLVKLFLIDEVHILKDPRGATLEAVVSRMKSIGANVRFVALSATVPNSQDIATWLGKDHTNNHLPAYRETFGEEFRPVKLQKHVYGFGGKSNDYAFDSLLDTKLPGLIAKHTTGKPIMIFCFTRKSCENTASKLADWWASLQPTERPWPIPPRKMAVGSKELSELVVCGVAFHHAGLDAQDRAAVETGFLRDGISVICCTSTLAVGVNLPCQLVIIKNTVCYTAEGLAEYSDLEVMQMLGRAGRPQFDTSAIAVIMTRTEKLERYNKMISGQDILESTLHLKLIEHLNSEIGLGTVHDLHSAKHWLAGTFLSVRMKQNPTYYKFSCDSGSRDADERLEKVCERDIESLRMTKLITSDQRFTCTEYGLAMCKYMVQFETMKLLLSIPQRAGVTQMLHIISQAEEFKDLRVKQNERAWFRELNKSPFIKSPIKENITTYAHKVSLTIQVQLGGIELPTDKDFSNRRQYLTEKVVIFDRVHRLVKCVVECKAYECDGVATCNALELARSISAEFWENSTLQLRQIPNIGPAAVRKLVQSNVKTIPQLAAMDSAAIERVMSRNPPFGHKVHDSLSAFPQLTLKVDILKRTMKQGNPVRVHAKAVLGFSNIGVPFWGRRTPCLTFTASTSNGVLAHIWRGPINRLEKSFEVAFTCNILEPDDEITCQLACEDIVGTIQTVVLKPELAASAFPPPEKRHMHENKVHKDYVRLTQDARETVLPINTERDGIGLGSDYGEDFAFEDFIDINQFEQNNEDEREQCIAGIEPTQMANGRWLCNHKCSHGRGIKKEILCKHICCKDGLDKPRKAPKKRSTTAETEFKSHKSMNHGCTKVLNEKTPEESRKPRFRLAERDVYFDDLEEVDLTNESLLVVENPEIPLGKRDQIHAKIGTMRLAKSIPLFSYASNSQPDTSQIGHFNQRRGIDAEFPSASELLRFEEDCAYDLDEDFQLHLNTFDFPSQLPGKIIETPLVSESFENGTFDFSTFSDAPQKPKNLLNTRRSPSPTPFEPEMKRRRIEENEKVELESAKPTPEWVNEMDAELVAYFKGCANFV